MSEDLLALRKRSDAALNRVAKWRSVFTGRILGTRLKGDAQGDGFRDLFEKLILLRVEATAITGILLRKGLVTEAELLEAFAEEADYLSEMYSRSFPGVSATDDGMSFHLPEARKTMEGWPP